MRPSSRRLVLVLACAIAGLVLAQSAAGGGLGAGGAGAVARAAGDAGAVAAARSAQDLPAVRRRGRLPAAPCRVLRGDRLAPPRDEAGRCSLAVRPVLRLGPARRRRQDEAATGSGVADPRARPERPRVGRDPFHRLAEVGHEHRLRLVPGRCRGEAPDGVRRVRRGRGGHVGAERALVGRAAGRRQRDARTFASFLRGLYDAAGEGPPTRGVVWIVGVGQRVPEIATYKARMQEWLQDSRLLGRHERVRQRLVAGGLRRRARLRGARSRRSTNRRDALVDYLRHSDLLAARRRRTPPARRTRSSRTREARSPTRRGSGAPRSGGRSSTVDLMQQYVSAEVYALRNHGARSGRPSDRFGFAWAPRNSEALARERLHAPDGGGARPARRGDPRLRRRTTADPGDRRVRSQRAEHLVRRRPRRRDAHRQLAGVPGLVADDPRVRLRRRRPSAQASCPAPDLPPGAGRRGRRAADGARRRDARPRRRPRGPSRRAPRDRSPRPSRFTLPAGAFATAQLFYQDATAGTVTLTASAAGVVAGTQPLTVTGGAPVSLRVDPPPATLLPGAVRDPHGRRASTQFGNATPTTALWTVTPGTLGSSHAGLRARRRRSPRAPPRARASSPRRSRPRRAADRDPSR